MSDTTPVRSLPFNPLHDDVPPDVGLPGEGDGGAFVVLLSDPDLDAPAWAPRTARALARSWAHSGRDVLLVDGFVEEPSLHSDLKRPVGEGLTDLVLWSASEDRVAQPVDSEPFRFISAGTVVPDADRVWNHARWPHLVSDLREMGRVTLLLAPGGDPGLGSITRIADQVVWLGDPLAVPAGDHPVALVLHPDDPARFGPREPEAAEDSLDDLPGSEGFELDPGVAEPAPPAAESERSPAAAADGLTDAEQESLAEKPEVVRSVARKEAAARVHRSTTPPRPGRTRASGGRRTGVLVLLLLAVLVAAGAGHFLGWFVVPGLPEVPPVP